MKNLHYLSTLLIIAGALNLGLVGAFNINLVEMLLGTIPMGIQATYIVIGLSGLYIVFGHKKDCKICSKI